MRRVCRRCSLESRHLSLSRLNHGQPGVQAHPDIVQGPADLHHESADALLPQADPGFHPPTPLDAAVDVLDPEPPLVERLVGQVLLPGQLRTAGLRRRHEDCHLRERDGQAAQLLQQPTPSRERGGGSLRDAQIMGTATVGVAQKEDREEGLDQQDIFDGVVFLLPALTRLLFNRVLGADDASLGAVMGKRGAAGVAVGTATTGADSSSSGVTTVAAVASATPRHWSRAAREGAGHPRGRAAPRARPAIGRGSTAWLCPGPCRISARASPGGRRF